MPGELRRYTSRPFPAYRYRPGGNAHPRRDPAGHSHGEPEPAAAPWKPEQWSTLEQWLWGIDLFNHRYWWESHEQHEALWHAAGRTTEHARFVQGLIKIAAACLNREVGKEHVAREQAAAGTVLMLSAPLGRDAAYMGIDLAAFSGGVARWFAGRVDDELLIALRTDGEGPNR
jgi:hypothetical protein